MRLSVSRISLFMGAGGFVLICLTTTFIVLREREVLFREARQQAQDAAFSLADHAARLFEVSDLAIRTTRLAMGDRGWDEVAASRALHLDMRTTADALPYFKDLYLMDEAGRLRLSTVVFPTPSVDVADRSIFREVREGRDEIAVGDPIVGRLTPAQTFLIARRITDAEGRFRGMAAASADINYFLDYWRRVDLSHDAHIAIIHAATGGVLVRLPAAAPLAATAVPALLAAVAGRPLGGRYAPASARMGFYHRIGDLPLYLAVSIGDAAIDREWHAWMGSFLLFPATAVAALIAIMALARRQSLTEARASLELNRARAQLAAANQQLERRVAERTAELKESNAEIQRFAYIMSHDLRAPLVNIMGFTSELERLRPEIFPDPSAVTAGRDPAPHAAASALREDFDESIGFIQSSIEKMDRLIKAILLLARQGNRAFAPEPVDTGALMRSIADSVAHRTQSRGATITIGPLPALVIDRISAEQVFSNLVDNAVKYLRPGVAGEIAVTGEIAGSRAVFHVADNGRGIEPRDHARVFELFRRSGPQDQPGDGIGLAHVKTLVRQLGGTISLASIPDEGSTFTVTLPLVPDGSVP